MARSLEEPRKRPIYVKGRSSCLTCKERHLKCDETLPSCQRCQRSARVCKPSWEKISTDDPTLRPSNTSPAANTRAVTSRAGDRLPTATILPTSPLDSKNRQSTEPTCVESSAANIEQRCTSAEPRATPAITTPDPGEDPTKDSTFVEIFEGQGKNMLHPGRTQRPGVQTGDDGPLLSMVSMEGSKLPADSFQRTADGANIPQQSSIIANQEEFESIPTKKRAAGTEATNPKRARGNDNDREGEDWTTTSAKSTKHIQTAEEDEHSVSTSEASGYASQADGEVFQTSGRASSEHCEAIKKARMALVVVDTQPTDFTRNRWSESSQSNMPPNSTIESNYKSPYHPMPHREKGRARITSSVYQELVTKYPGNLASRRHAKLSAQSASNPDHSQSTPPSVGLSHNSPESSNPDIPAGPEQGRQSSVVLPVPASATQDSSKLWNAQSTLAADGDCRSTARDTQSPSVDDDSPRDGIDYPKTSNSNQFTSMLGCFDSRPYRPMTQAFHHMPNHTSMQDPDTKPAGNYGADNLHASHQPDSGKFHNSSSSAAMLATALQWEDASDSSVNPNQRQPLGYRGNSVPHALEMGLRPHANTHTSDGFLQSAYQPPAIKFGIDNKVESDLSSADTQSLFETFSRNGQVLVRPKKSLNRDKVYPVGVIIWQSSADFYKWFLTETGISQIAILKFELLDASGKFEKAFFIQGGDLYYFQILKQYIWDSFWVTSKLNGAAASFKVLVRTAQHMDTSVGSWGNVVTTGLPAEHPTAPKLGNVGTVADSLTPAAPIPRRNNGSTPHYNEAATRQIPFTAPARISNSVTASQMQFAPVLMNTNSRIARQPERPEPFIDLSSPLHGTASMDLAIISTRQHQPGEAPQLCDPSSQRTAIAPLLAPEIVVYLQIDGTGRLSHIYDKSVLRPKVTAMGFFAWFGSQTGRGGDKGPPSLRFTFKDAIPTPKSRTITQTNEDHFDLMRNDIKAQLRKTMKYMQNLQGFTILVTDPEWVLDEDW